MIRLVITIGFIHACIMIDESSTFLYQHYLLIKGIEFNGHAELQIPFQHHLVIVNASNLLHIKRRETILVLGIKPSSFPYQYLKKISYQHQRPTHQQGRSIPHSFHILLSMPNSPFYIFIIQFKLITMCWTILS